MLQPVFHHGNLVFTQYVYLLLFSFWKVLHQLFWINTTGSLQYKQVS